MKPFLLSCLLAIATLTPIAFSETVNDKIIGTHRFSPCSSWAYDFEAHGYVCGNFGANITVPDARDVERTIDALERQIEALEARVTQLENSQR